MRTPSQSAPIPVVSAIRHKEEQLRRPGPRKCTRKKQEARKKARCAAAVSDPDVTIPTSWLQKRPTEPDNQASEGPPRPVLARGTLKKQDARKKARCAADVSEPGVTIPRSRRRKKAPKTRKLGVGGTKKGAWPDATQNPTTRGTRRTKRESAGSTLRRLPPRKNACRSTLPTGTQIRDCVAWLLIERYKERHHTAPTECSF